MFWGYKNHQPTDQEERYSDWPPGHPQNVPLGELTTTDPEQKRKTRAPAYTLTNLYNRAKKNGNPIGQERKLRSSFGEDRLGEG